MVAKDSPDWLPAGWTVQFRVQKTGRRVKIYTNLETGKKFFSKDDVLNCIKAGSSHSAVLHSTDRHISEQAERTPLQLVNEKDELPEWLPKGWKVEVKTRKSGLLIGKEYKCYINPFNRCKFYSKMEVLRYLKTARHKGCIPKDIKTIKRKSDILEKRTGIGVKRKSDIVEKKTGISMLSANKVVVEKCEVEDLPSGWTKEIRIRKTSNVIRKDPFYTDPVSGYVFRSKKDALRYVATGEIGRHAFRPKDSCISAGELMEDETAPISTAKRQKSKPSAIRQQLFADKMNTDASNSESKPEGSKISNAKCVFPEAKENTKVTFSSRDEIVQGKLPLENASQECVQTKEKCASNRSSVQKSEASKRVGDKSSPLSDAGVSEKSQAKRYSAENNPVSTSAPDILQEKNCLRTVMEKSSVKEAQVNSRKSKGKKVLDMPPRSSKRLAGLEPDQAVNLDLGERALITAIRKSKNTEPIQDAGLTSDCLVDGALSQPETRLETEFADHTSTNTNNPLRGDPSNKTTVPLGDQVLSQDQHQKLETEKINDNPGPQLSLLFGSDPCLEFAFKTLLGELPLDDSPLEEPILTHAGGTPQHENLLESEMKITSSRKGHVNRNKSKRKKELNLPRRSSKRLAGFEPEPVENSVASEQALQNASTKTYEKGTISGTDLLDEANQSLGSGPVSELQNQLSNTETSMREEPLSIRDELFDNPAPPQEQPQMHDTQEAELEKPEPSFSVPFADYWSDPCLDFAFKTLTGVIPIEDSFAQSDFQEQVAITHNHRNSSLSLPDFDSPSLFQTDISSQFDTPEKSVPGQQLSVTPPFLPAGNVNFTSCSGVHSQQQCLDGTKDLHQKVKS